MLAPFASLASNKRPLVLATVLITAMLAGEILAQSVPMRSCLDLFLLRRGRYKAYSSLDTNKQLFCEHRGMQKPGDMVQNAQGLIIATHEDINEFHRSEINALIDYFDPPCHRFFKNTMSVFEGDKRTGTSSDYPYCQLMTFLDPLKFLEEIQLVVGDNNWAEEQDKHLFKPLERVDRCLDAIIPAIERLGGYHEVLIYSLNFGSKIEKDSNNHHLFAYLKKGPQVLTKEREFRKLWKKLDGFKDALNAYVLTKSEIESTEKRYGESCQVLVNTLKPVFEGPSCVGEEGGASLAKAIEVDEELLEMYSGDVSSIRDIYHFIKHWRAYFGCQLYLLHKQYKTPGQRLMQHLVNCVKPKDSVEKQEKPSEEDLI